MGVFSLARLLPLAVSLLPISAVVPSASAHPHAWITTAAAVVFNAQGEVTALNISWIFDKDYSHYAIDGLDTDGDGKFSPGELMVLSDENVKALREYDYFVYARVGKKKLPWGMVADYGMGHSADERLDLQMVPAAGCAHRSAPRRFQLPDLRSHLLHRHRISRQNPIAVIGTPPHGCKVALLPSPSDQQTAQTRNMLAAKPMDWQPDPGEDFGSMFAQVVKVECSKANS